jgi:hypothetical protein
VRRTQGGGGDQQAAGCREQADATGDPHAASPGPESGERG